MTLRTVNDIINYKQINQVVAKALEIRYSKQAVKYIKKLDKPTKLRIKAGIEKIPDGDIKPLQGRAPFQRLRIGDYRIIFTIDGEILAVEKIKSRGDVY